MKDFFISYNKADHAWAEWIAWQLEDAGYTTIIQAWDFRPSSNFVSEMNRAASEAERTIAVLSPEYLRATYPESEWAAAFAKDPTGEKGFLLPVRVEECELRGLLSQIIYVDLVGLDEAETKRALLKGVNLSRAKPTHPPAFPSPTRSKPRQFPGIAVQKISPEPRPFGRYWGIVIGFFVIAFLLIVFIIQRNGQAPSRNTEHELSKEKDKEAPRLNGEIEQVIVDRSPAADGAQVFILLSIRNTGGTSMVEDFLVNIRSADLDYKGEAKEFPKETLSLLDEKKSKVTIHHQDSMDAKVVNPIEPGTRMRGWLMFLVKGEGVKPEILRRPKTRFTISFSDILGQSYSVSYEIPQHSVNP